MSLSIEFYFSPERLSFNLAQGGKTELGSQNEGIFTEVKKPQLYREANDLEKVRLEKEFGEGGVLFFNSIEEVVNAQGEVEMADVPLIAFTSPRELVVPGTRGKSLKELTSPIEADVRYLRLRAGMVNYDQFTPNRKETFIKLAEEFLGKTGETLFGEKYGRPCFTLQNGSVVSLVGSEYKVDGRKPDERGEGNTFVLRLGTIRSRILPQLSPRK